MGVDSPIANNSQLYVIPEEVIQQAHRGYMQCGAKAMGNED